MSFSPLLTFSPSALVECLCEADLVSGMEETTSFESGAWEQLNLKVLMSGYLSMERQVKT